MKQKSLLRSMFIFFLAIISILILVTGLLYIKFNRVIYTQVMNDQKNSLRNNKYIFERFVSDIEDTLFDVRMNKNIATSLNKATNDPLDVINTREDIREELTLVDNYVLESSYVVLFADHVLPFASHLLDFDTDLFQEEKMLKGAYNNYHVKEHAWYKDALSHRDQVKSFYSEDTDTIYFISGIENPFIKPTTYNFKEHDSTYAMVAVIRLPRSSMITMAQSLYLIEDSIIRIYNESRDLLYTYPENTHYVEDNYVIVSESFSNDWSIDVAIPTTYIRKQTVFVKYYLVLTFLVLLLVVGFFALWNMRYILNPIGRLSHTMKKRNVPLHQYSIAKPEWVKENEIAVLYDNFNAMIQRVAHSVEKEKEAEFKALQAQINPHFIYNTLDAINWIALMNDQDPIVDMTTTLSEILKYSMTDPNAFITVEEEIHYINAYITIENIRYDDAIKFETNISSHLLGLHIPKFIFQPLIENGVKHGVMKNGGGRIVLTGQIVEDQAIFTLTDEGPGFNQDLLNTYLSTPDVIVPESNGIGILNVNERIQTHYGSTYGLTFSSQDEKGLVVTITLPLDYQIADRR